MLTRIGLPLRFRLGQRFRRPTDTNRRGCRVCCRQVWARFAGQPVGHVLLSIPCGPRCRRIGSRLCQLHGGIGEVRSYQCRSVSGAVGEQQSAPIGRAERSVERSADRVHRRRGDGGVDDRRTAESRARRAGPDRRQSSARRSAATAARSASAIETAESNLGLAATGADFVFLTIKPQVLGTVMKQLQGKLEAEPGGRLGHCRRAGIDTLAAQLGHDAIVRVMPNTPAQIGQGMIVWFRDRRGDRRARATGCRRRSGHWARN